MPHNFNWLLVGFVYSLSTRLVFFTNDILACDQVGENLTAAVDSTDCVGAKNTRTGQFEQVGAEEATRRPYIRQRPTRLRSQSHGKFLRFR